MSAEAQENDVESKPTRGFAVLSDELDGEPPYKIRGIALGEGDVTVGQSGIKKVWPGETLKDSAGTLENKPLVKNHVNHDVDAVIGEILKSKFVDGDGVAYEGEIDSLDVATKISRGRLDVSPRIRHEPVEEMEVREDDDARVVGEIEEFVNLAVVPRGASPSNEISLGEHDDLSEEYLRRLFEPDTDAPDGAESGSSEEEDGTPSEEEESAESESEELEEHSVHEPEFSDTADQEWNAPNMEDFETDDLSEIDDHFLVSKSGFPPGDFGDLALPVVEPDGTLNLNALSNAKARAGQVGGLSDEDQSRVESMINSLANDNFEDANFGEEEEENSLHTFSRSLFDRPVSEDEIDSAVNSLNSISGINAVGKGDTDRPELVVVVDPDEIGGDLNEDVKNALEDTPFSLRDDFDWVDEVVAEESRLEDDESRDSTEYDLVSVFEDDEENESTLEDIEILTF